MFYNIKGHLELGPSIEVRGFLDILNEEIFESVLRTEAIRAERIGYANGTDNRSFLIKRD